VPDYAARDRAAQVAMKWLVLMAPKNEGAQSTGITFNTLIQYVQAKEHEQMEITELERVDGSRG
jgi:hypothetical protein